jgi:hypothetical protein
MADKPVKLYQATISTALLYKVEGAYGTWDKAINALMRRKSVLKIGIEKLECERLFKLAVKVVDDSLEFESSNKILQDRSGWIDEVTINEVCRQMENYLRIRNPEAPVEFISPNIFRILWHYHLA